MAQLLVSADFWIGFASGVMFLGVALMGFFAVEIWREGRAEDVP
jgi:hypothetical protein